MKNKIYSKRNFLKILGISTLGLGSFSIYDFFNKDLKKSTWSGEVLNSPVKLEIHSNDYKKNNSLITQIEEKVHYFENIFNLQNKNSEISILNKEKFIKNPSAPLIDVINKSLLISKETNGLFDVTVQPLWDMYYKHFIIEGNKKAPEKYLIKETIKFVDWKNVKAEKKYIKLENNSSITLNGIAQGWITDNITSILRNNNINNTLVDFGETYASGKYNNMRPWNILIENSNASQIINLSNKAIATSAGSGTAFDSKYKYHHIFNPKTGLNSKKFKSLSIISDKAWLSDALSTACYSMKKDSLKEICDRFKAEAIFFEKGIFKKLS